jgi:short-subunit dehydrogenase involved in D-alanine esterification of teichoic acids
MQELELRDHWKKYLQKSKNFETNLFGPIEVMKAALPQMRHKKSGLIINILLLLDIWVCRIGPFILLQRALN